MGFLATLPLALGATAPAVEETRPNILFCIADDWGYPHAGAYGEPVIETPAFDRLAAEGVLFEHAYVSSPSCTPSRSAILTGQWHWRLEEAANLHSTLRAEHAVYPELLAAAGYHVGSYRKAWGPGRLQPGGRETRPAGKRYPGLAAFLEERPTDAPFCFWLGSSDPHRPYEKGSGAARGMDLSAVRLPACFPDAAAVRGDVADYFFEVERFDRDVGAALELLEAEGLLDNTLVVMTGDHGMPFPRCKGNLYDTGARVPLAMRLGERWAGSRVSSFVSLVDLAPTFLALAGLDVPDAMSGRDLVRLADGEDPSPRTFVLSGRERHTPAQLYPSGVGYPSRSIRTSEYLLIENFAPDRWPAGVPEGSTRGPVFSDCDDGPTRRFLLERRDEDSVRPFFERAFAKRPAVELYDLRKDSGQWNNVAEEAQYAAMREQLKQKLDEELRREGDPRVLGGAERFDAFPYYGSLQKAERRKVPAARLQVYLLVGESTMEGKGEAKTLAWWLREDEKHRALLPPLLRSDGAWAKRDDVWVSFGERTGRLTVGFGAEPGEDGDLIGPELGFGTIMGDHHDAPVLLVKAAWGGKDLAKDFSSPGSGGPGPSYTKMLETVRDVLASPRKHVPFYVGQGVDLRGLVWFQGWSDMVDREKSAAYTENLMQWIRDLRSDLGVPDLPVVLGELGAGGEEADERVLRFRAAQEAVARTPGLDGVHFVRTAPLWDAMARETLELDLFRGTDAAGFRREVSDGPDHYLGSAKTYYLLGHAFGLEMAKHVGKR